MRNYRYTLVAALLFVFASSYQLHASEVTIGIQPEEFGSWKYEYTIEQTQMGVSQPPIVTSGTISWQHFGEEESKVLLVVEGHPFSLEFVRNQVSKEILEAMGTSSLPAFEPRFSIDTESGQFELYNAQELLDSAQALQGELSKFVASVEALEKPNFEMSMLALGAAAIAEQVGEYNTIQAVKNKYEDDFFFMNIALGQTFEPGVVHTKNVVVPPASGAVPAFDAVANSTLQSSHNQIATISTDVVFDDQELLSGFSSGIKQRIAAAEGEDRAKEIFAAQFPEFSATMSAHVTQDINTHSGWIHACRVELIATIQPKPAVSIEIASTMVITELTE